MRKLLLIICAAAFFATWASDSNADNHNWLVLERNGGPQPEVITVLRELPPQAIRKNFPVLLKIKWGYESLPNGMPTEGELVKARDLYKALDQIFGDDGFFAMSRTGDGGRIIYYYVKNPTPYTQALEQYFASGPPISVRVSKTSEPGWDSIKEVLSAVK